MTGILTTHVGSLPRSAAVTDVLFAVERGEPVDPAVFDGTIGNARPRAAARRRIGVRGALVK
jgi:5-methyltetrahydropteroyltriglutamate--homocysteine methyltransferase